MSIILCFPILELSSNLLAAQIAAVKIGLDKVASLPGWLLCSYLYIRANVSTLLRSPAAALPLPCAPFPAATRVF